MSRTMTVKDPVALFPAASVAVTFTALGPMGKKLPLAGVWTTVGADTRSVAVAGAKLTMAPVASVAAKVCVPGTVMVGGVVSRTVTWNAQMAEFPEPSVAVAVTGVVPSGNWLPWVGV